MDDMDLQGNLITEDEIATLIGEPVWGIESEPTSGEGVYWSSRYRVGEKQEKSVWCGPFTIKQMIYELKNILLCQSVLAAKAGTRSGGTGHQGLINTLQGEGLHAEFVTFNSLGWTSLGQKLADSNVSIGFHALYQDKWGHYMYPVYVNTVKRIIGLLDSLNSHQDIIYVSFNEFERWVRDTPGNQRSVLIATKK